MSDHESFLRTIYESSDDDTPRLVYADWLEENGYALLAEFIRVEIEIAKGDVGPRRAELMRRDKDLFENRLGWRRLPPRWTAQNKSQYRKGLLFEWRGEVGEFLKYRDELWSYGPIYSLIVSGADADFVQLAACVALKKISDLVLYPKRNFDEGGIAIAASDNLKQIKHMRLSRYRTRISTRAIDGLTQRFGEKFELR